MDIGDQLQKLQKLYESGGLSHAEYAKAKDLLLNSAAASTTPNYYQAPDFSAAAENFVPEAPLPVAQPVITDAETRQWGMFIHFSLLAGFLVPFAGLILPILIWQVKKNELPGVDIHGKIAVNAIITFLIYGIFSILLCFVLIGIPLLFALGLAGIIFPIIGGIKANNGEAWKYPLLIEFI
ncbi:MAG: DUF4870 domain-containing protein [Pirellulales bacterium]|nr:DUF4870 domain-containing protein [Pirellulales bacterium]